ncbi:FH protein interacting protein FIP2-like isoform X5 [Zingiber officinale]|uniref:FH protein interacting protein FIP2-like isoform X5 n=1 Tax=Zingiber officinale TaxID=94328 RepID=UPI001C4D2C8A|nr:FH protein interacting protein FIP2-like isoform X5 [Zingiber officinale]
MEPGSPWPSSQVFLNVGRSIIPGGKKYTTTIDTLTQREPDSMLAAMFSGRYTVSTDDKTGMIFIDRDGKHFRHILNWLRDGIIPMLQDSDYQELIREAEYYQLLGLIENINANLCNRKDKDAPVVELTELTRKEVIQIIQSEKVRFRGVNLSGLDLSKLDAEAGGSIFEDANLRECELIGADLHQAKLDRANLQSANLQDACLTQCSLCDADLRSAHLQSAKLSGANLQGANLEGANLKGAKLNSANLQDANLQRAYLREVDLRDSQLEGAKMGGANLLGVIR